MPSQAGHIAVVTGANSGLGLETSVALAAAGARVIMACRNPEKAASALDEVRRRAPQSDVALMTLDLSSLASVRAFAGAFNDRHSRLDLLINNAGIMGVPLGRTVDGFESQMGTNHFGHFALTGLLIDTLMATAGARIITLGSLGHWRASGFDVDDLGYERTPYSNFGAYCNSKLANLLFVLELSRRLAAKGSKVIAAAAHPGFAATNIKPAPTHPLIAPISAAYRRIMTPIAVKYLLNSAEIGALPTLYAATAPGVGGNDYYGPSGFKELRGYPAKARRHPAASDAATAQRLWAVSAALTGVSYLG
jgi:NAD(P)-dependent dehydrogenase (short-subunit alcohol dehydrogenase family)